MVSSISVVNYLRALVELFWMQYGEKVIVEGNASAKRAIAEIPAI